MYELLGWPESVIVFTLNSATRPPNSLTWSSLFWRKDIMSRRLNGNCCLSGQCHLPLQEVDYFDNKLEFSDRKIAIGQGFRYSNFKVASK